MLFLKILMIPVRIMYGVLLGPIGLSIGYYQKMYARLQRQIRVGFIYPKWQKNKEKESRIKKELCHAKVEKYIEEREYLGQKHKNRRRSLIYYRYMIFIVKLILGTPVAFVLGIVLGPIQSVRIYFEKDEV